MKAFLLTALMAVLPAALIAETNAPEAKHFAWAIQPFAMMADSVLSGNGSAGIVLELDFALGDGYLGAVGHYTHRDSSTTTYNLPWVTTGDSAMLEFFYRFTFNTNPNGPMDGLYWGPGLLLGGSAQATNGAPSGNSVKFDLYVDGGYRFLFGGFVLDLGLGIGWEGPGASILYGFVPRINLGMGWAY